MLSIADTYTKCWCIICPVRFYNVRYHTRPWSFVLANCVCAKMMLRFVLYSFCIHSYCIFCIFHKRSERERGRTYFLSTSERSVACINIKYRFYKKVMGNVSFTDTSFSTFLYWTSPKVPWETITLNSGPKKGLTTPVSTLVFAVRSTSVRLLQLLVRVRDFEYKVKLVQDRLNHDMYPAKYQLNVQHKTNWRYNNHI